MRTPILLCGLVACTATTEPPIDSAADTGTSPVVWTAQRACHAIRLFAAAGDRGLAIAVDAPVVTAVLDQQTLILDVDFAAGLAAGVVQDGIHEDDVCSSLEEFPPVGPGPSWQMSGGTLHLEFVPAAGLGTDDTAWMSDGTEVGTVHAELRDAILTPRDPSSGDAELPDLDLDLPLTVPDLPA